MALFHRVNTVIQTCSQFVIAVFCIWIAANMIHCSNETSNAVASLPNLDKLSGLDVPKDSSVSVIPPDPQLQAQNQARRALRDALSSTPRSDYNAELRRIEQERKWQQMREDEERALRDSLPNGPRQK